MKVLGTLREHRAALAITVALLLVIAGRISAALLLEGTPSVSRRIGPAPGFPRYGGKAVKTQAAGGDLKALGTDAVRETVGLSLPPLRDRIIKNGSLTLKVKKGRFGTTYERIMIIAQAHGGYIAGSSSVSADDRLTSGTLTIRVPAKDFELVLAKVRRLGKLTTLDVNSQDVSTEFVDLESRLRHWRSQEAILLGLMEKADNIGDSISVQQQLSQVQQEIEQITGRLNYLKDQTEFSSLQLMITEPGALPKPLDPWGFKTAVSQAAHAFVNTFNGLIVLTGYLSPLVIMAGLAGLIWVAVRRRLTVAAN